MLGCIFVALMSARIVTVCQDKSYTLVSYLWLVCMKNIYLIDRGQDSLNECGSFSIQAIMVTSFIWLTFPIKCSFYIDKTSYTV